MQISMAHILGVPLEGTVTDFGSVDVEDRYRRLFVRVEIKLGKWTSNSYYSQSSVKKVK